MSQYTAPRGLTSALGLGLLSLGLSLGAVALGQPAQAQTEPEWHNCLTREVFSPAKRAWCNRWQTLQNGTYLIATPGHHDSLYTNVTLTHGQYQAPGELVVVLANEPGWIAFGDLNGDRKDDAAVILGVLPGDGATLATTYVTAVMDIDGSARAMNPVLLGERIMLNGPMTVENLSIHVPQLTQTEVINRSFGVEGSTLSELDPQPTPEPVPGGVPDGTLVFSHTTTYAVRLFTQEGQPYINLFNHQTGQLEVNAEPAVALSGIEGTHYQYGGSDISPAVRVSLSPDGSQTLEVNDIVQTDRSTVIGTVTYLPRIALPPNAVVEVQLVDVSRADAPAQLLASQSTITGGRQVPIPFELMYNPNQIDPRMTLAVQARITVDGELQFISTRRFAVSTQGQASPVEVVVDPVQP